MRFERRAWACPSALLVSHTQRLPLPPTTHPSATSEGRAWAAALERFEAARERFEAAKAEDEAETDSWWDVRSNDSEPSDELSFMGRSLADDGKEREYKPCAGWLGGSDIGAACFPCLGPAACHSALQLPRAQCQEQRRPLSCLLLPLPPVAAWLRSLLGLPLGALEVLFSFVATQVAHSYAHITDISPCLKVRGWRLPGALPLSICVPGSSLAWLFWMHEQC